ncbi:MAG TPA: NAD(P)/FAD-dependent oxidoreductase [Acidimicrobiales bacterium]|nr:NAD(P)/FAD-dependent oxidoreductase [Acidimicrobiales bacterium]
MTGSIAAVLGEIGLPMAVSDLAARRWDAIVVGGGHNGLAAAAYLARAGRRTLVLERRDRLGGACSLERPFPDPRYVISPCAYLVGLLHPVVIEELELARRGYRVSRCDPSQWSPFLDGSSFTDWHDPARTAASVRRLAPADVDGYFAYQDVYDRIRARLRSPHADTWIGESPDRDRLESLLAGDPKAREAVFEMSVADLVERHVTDERLRAALHGAGVIGTWAGPRDPGTAGVRAMHNMGLLGGWGYVEGGMGQVSYALAEAAAEAGAVLAAGLPVARIEPGTGVWLDDGTRLTAPVVLCNADPHRTLGLLDRSSVPTAWQERIAGWDVRSPVLKLNCALRRLPRFPASPGDFVYRSMVVLSTGIDDTQAAFAAACRGEPAPQWCELYFQTAHDPSMAPDGRHVMSVFAQYAPYTLASGDWSTRRPEIAELLLRHIARWAPDVVDCVEYWELLGPPDVEARIGLTGGHIFQGSCLPAQMWDRRLPARTPMPGLYLCGAATHPGGSVIGINGRNAAMAVLADQAGSGR